MTGFAGSVAHRRRFVGLEEELLTLVGQNRNGQISARYFGLDGGGGASLQTVGDQYGITRERVRQIVSAVAERIAASKAETPCLDRVISFAQQKAPIRASECEDALRATGLIAERFRLEGVLHAAELLGKSSPFLLSEDKNRTVLGLTNKDDFDSVVRAGHQEVVSWGMTTVERVIARAQGEDSKRRYDVAFVERALSCRDDFHWLDPKKMWFWFSKTKRNRVLSRARKILAITNPIGLNDLLNGLGRHYRMQGFSPPSAVLLEFCRHAPGLSVGKDHVASENPIDPIEALSPVEQELFRIFAENGGTMTRRAVAEQCADLGMNQLTMEQYLVYSPILSRHGGARYSLIGRVDARLESIGIHSDGRCPTPQRR